MCPILPGVSARSYWWYRLIPFFWLYITLNVGTEPRNRLTGNYSFTGVGEKPDQVSFKRRPGRGIADRAYLFTYLYFDSRMGRAGG